MSSRHDRIKLDSIDYNLEEKNGEKYMDQLLDSFEARKLKWWEVAKSKTYESVRLFIFK